MNEFQITLYNQLLALVNVNEAFFFKDQVLEDVIYRVFSYRLASYTDFCTDCALESRGIMFEMNQESPIRLAAMPMAKFFNDSENPITMDLDYTTIQQVMLKMDGSLMSTYIHDNELRIKSKTALASEHAVNAMRWLALPKNSNFSDELAFITDSLGYTVNLEYTSPEPNMRIVIGYQEPRLTVLNIRNRTDGKYIPKEWFELRQYRSITRHWVEQVSITDGPVFVKSITDMTGIEGYVIQLQTGQLVKKKTMWYSALHKTKDSITNPRRLFEVVLDEASDDLRQMFADDPYSLKAIDDMEIQVGKWYNHLVKSVEDFHDKYKDADRKTYAIAGQAELDSRGFAIAMLIYTGKTFSYKELMKKWYKEFGLTDTFSIANEE
jgi:T4 RnlA family RNA ligase